MESKWMENITPDKQELRTTGIARLILDKAYFKVKDILENVWRISHLLKEFQNLTKLQ